MNPNPLSDREKALENQWIREKECVSSAPLVMWRQETDVSQETNGKR
jgi:hypothetical protein